MEHRFSWFVRKFSSEKKIVNSLFFRYNSSDFFSLCMSDGQQPTGSTPPPSGGQFHQQGNPPQGFQPPPQQGGAGTPPPGYGYPPPGYGYPPPGYDPSVAQQGAPGTPPPGYGYPPPGYGYPPQPGYGTPPPPPPKPIVPIGKFGREDSFTTTIRLPKHSLTIDEPRFLRLLAGSASLMKDEKRRIIEAVPRLTQEQIDELIRILEEEKQKFSELDVEHKGQLEALESKQKQEWEELEMEMNAGERQEQEDSAADAIRQQLSGKKKENES